MGQQVSTIPVPLVASAVKVRWERSTARVRQLESELVEARHEQAAAQLEYLAALATPRELPTLLRVPEAARRLAISQSKLYGMIQRRELPAIQVGDGSTRVAAIDLEAYIAEHSAPRG